MPYLTESADIESAILELTQYPILWLDTEVAEWWTPQPKLSLIQALADGRDRDGLPPIS